MSNEENPYKPPSMLDEEGDRKKTCTDTLKDENMKTLIIITIIWTANDIFWALMRQ